MSSIFKGLGPVRQYRAVRAVCGTALAAVLLLAGCSKSPEPPVKGSPPHLRLITTQQYINTLSHVFGPSLHLELRFPPMRRTDGLLENGASVAGVTAAQLEQFQRAAAGIAAQVVDEKHRDYLVPCKPADKDAPDKACATEFLSRIGPMLRRRPMTPADMQVYVDQAGARPRRSRTSTADCRSRWKACSSAPISCLSRRRASPIRTMPGITDSMPTRWLHD